MDAERWQHIQSLFHEAAALPVGERDRFLAQACARDLDTLREVLSLLEEDDRHTSMLDLDVSDVARSVMSDDRLRLAPRVIGPYRILKLLGQGGMGVVYLAERGDLDNRVALKLLPHAWMSPARRDRFALEARTLSRLNHPSIARLYDAGALDDGTPWFAMEYVEGLPLTDYCARFAPDLRDRLRIFRCVCEAVQCAHDQAILHRDLKPSNILVKSDGSVRLLDFGIAKQLDALENADLTRTGLRLATPGYAAPEQLRGEPAAIQADVYSLGVILYELLTGQLPFDVSARTAAEAAGIDANPPEKPSAVTQRSLSEGRGFWADLDVLCLTAIHTDTRRRYRSVEALIRDIEHLLDNEPLEARPDDFGYRLGKFVTRNRAPLAASGLALILMIALVTFFTVRLAGARDAALAEAARTQRIQQFMMKLFEGGDANVGPAEDLRVITLIDRSAREVELLSADPAVQADLYQTLGNVYHNLGKLDRAERFLEAALRTHAPQSSAGNARESERLVALGLLRVDQGKLGEAEALVRQGLDFARNNLPAGHPAITSAASALGRVFMDRGQYEKAVQTLEEAVRLHPATSAPTQAFAEAVIRLANAQFYSGRYDDSESLNRRVLEMYKGMYGERHPMLADPIINLGAIAQQRARYRDAEELYRQAFELNRGHHGTSHPETAAALMGFARSLVSQKRFDEAEPLLQEVLAIRERAYGPAHPNVASTLSSLGHVAQERGDLEAAEKCFRRMADIYRAVNGDGHHFVGLALSNLAGVFLARGEYREAEKIFRDVLRRYQEVLPPDHLDVGIARVKFGHALLRQGRYREAEQESSAGLNILERKTGPSSPWLISARDNLAAIRAAISQR